MMDPTSQLEAHMMNSEMFEEAGEEAAISARDFSSLS